MPEFPGNRRLDGVQNLVERPGVGLLFIVPGITETLRVNGIGRLTRDPELCALCATDGKPPWFVDRRRGATGLLGIAARRSSGPGLWNPDAWANPAAVVSPSKTIAERASVEGRPEQDVRREVDESYRPASTRKGTQLVGAPSASQGSVPRPPTTGATRSISASDRSIATGFRPPTPE